MKQFNTLLRALLLGAIVLLPGGLLLIPLYILLKEKVMFSYDENYMGHITLFSPNGESVYLQTDTDIEFFNNSINAIADQWLANGTGNCAILVVSKA